MLTDRELLAEYAATGSSAAFAELTGRHSGTVYAACLRILGRTDAAEDAAQAVFIVLARKARRLAGERGLAGWLVLTARHVGMRMRRDEMLRQAREREAAEMMARDRACASWGDVSPQLDAALAALPASQRAVLTLRFLEGRSCGETAREMGWSEASVSVAASRALERLRRVLALRGVRPSAAVLAGLLGQRAVDTVPAGLAGSLAALGTGPAAASPAAMALAEGTMKAMTIAKVKLAAAVIGVVLAAVAGGGALTASLLAGETAPASEVLPKLPPDPKVMRLINDLGDNSSVELPPVKTVGEWTAATKAFGMEKTGPVGRDFCMKAAWMPDRKRAFFCGVNHGSPHRINDAWEYDLPSNTWVMLHPPDETWNAKIYEVRDVEYRGTDGRPVKTKWVFTRNGGVACGSHTWGGLTYDPTIRAAIWVPAHYGGMGGRKWLQEQGVKDVYQGSVPWAYYPFERVWRPVLSDKPWPKLNEGGALEFVPELNLCVWSLNNWNADGTWGYEGRSNTWKKLHEPTADVPKWALMAYDRAAKVIVAQDTAKSTYHFDVTTLKWKKVLSPGADSNDAPYGADWCGAMFYDPLNKVCLAYNTPSGQGDIRNVQEAVWIYSATDRKWTRHVPNGPGYSAIKGARATSYFDPERNVLVINAAEKTWLYRYRKAASAR